MFNKLITGLFVSTLLLSNTLVNAKGIDKEIRELIDDANSFIDVPVPLYNPALDKFLEAYGQLKPEDRDAELDFKIGICYLNTIHKTEAIPYLESALKKDPGVSEEIYYLLAYAQQLNGDFDDANKNYIQYKKTLSDRDLAKKWMPNYYANQFLLSKRRGGTGDLTVEVENLNGIIIKRMGECRNAKKLTEDPVDVTINSISSKINSFYPEYAPVISADESVMYFTSKREGSTGGDTSNFDGLFYEDVYLSLKTQDDWTEPENIGTPINDSSHNSAIGLSADGSVMYLYNVDEEHGGDIYQSTLEGDQWTAPERLPEPINSDAHEVSASLSADGRTLFFVSNREGGEGGTDIYMSKLGADGKWGAADNLGRTVNTPYDEEGVFFHPDGKTLYFSSTGHRIGMGGFDIYKTEMSQSGKRIKWSRPENLGYPINTAGHDIYFVLGASGEKGYYSSIKKNSVGSVDIYEITFPNTGEKKDLTLLTGVVYDSETKDSLEAIVLIEDIAKQEIVGELKTNSKTGKYLISLPAGRNYSVSVNKPGYLFHSENFSIEVAAGFQKVRKDIPLQKLTESSTITLRNVFFEFDSDKLVDSISITELQKVIKLMADNPSMKVELGGHTDSKGNDTYNKNLSEKRATTVVNYIVEKGGIAKDRLVSVGYGETQPIAPNENEDGSDNPEGRALNRRTVFKILEIDEDAHLNIEIKDPGEDSNIKVEE